MGFKVKTSMGYVWQKIFIKRGLILEISSWSTYKMNVKAFKMENQPTFPMRMTKDPNNVACQHSEEAALKEHRVNI